MELTEEAFGKAKVVLRNCSAPHGMYASAGSGGYNSVWARDSMIGLIGASAADKGEEFKNQFRLTLSTLKKNQSASGQIPNDVDLWGGKRPKQVTFATIDSTLWYLLGIKAYEKNYRTKSLAREHRHSIGRAFFWLLCQDAGEDSLPEQLPTSDWQDCFPHKYGHTINTIALYYACLQAYGKERAAREVKRAAGGLSRHKIRMFDNKKGYFLPWQWKNHDGDIEREFWFDGLGNCLAICSGLASKSEAEKILDFIEKEKINQPFPLRAIYPPIRRGDKAWHSYFSRCLAAKPNWYINGGIWPYIGGFYVASLVKAKRFAMAERELMQLAKANRLGIRHKWEFNEWVHPTKRKAMGSAYHAWSAGAYLFAFRSVLDKKIPVFG